MRTKIGNKTKLNYKGWNKIRINAKYKKIAIKIIMTKLNIKIMK